MTAPAGNAPAPVQPVSEAEVAPVHVIAVHDPLVRAMVPVPELGQPVARVPVAMVCPVSESVPPLRQVGKSMSCGSLYGSKKTAGRKRPAKHPHHHKKAA